MSCSFHIKELFYANTRLSFWFWLPSCAYFLPLIRINNRLSLDASPIDDESRTKLTLYTIVGKKVDNRDVSDIDTIMSDLVIAREAQLKNDLALFGTNIDDPLLLARLAHNILTISNQINKKEKIPKHVTSLLLKYAIDVTLNFTNITELINNYSFNKVRAFQDRSTPFQKLDNFFLDRNKHIQYIVGQKQMGKRSLIQEALCKLRLDRLPIEIECKAGMNVYNIIEVILECLKGGKYISKYLFDNFLDSDSIDNYYTNELDNILRAICAKTIFILYEFETLLDEQQNIPKGFVSDFFDRIISIDDSKLIVESDISMDGIDNIFISRFPSKTDGKLSDRYQYVIHYFQETIPMDYRVEDETYSGYPLELLKCSDNHPYFTAFLSKKIAEQEDKKCLQNPKFLGQLKKMVYQEAISAYQLDIEERKTLFMLSICGNSIPSEVLDAMFEYRQQICVLIRKGIILERNNDKYTVMSEVRTIDEDVITDEVPDLYRYMIDVFSHVYEISKSPTIYRYLTYCKLMQNSTREDVIYSRYYNTEIFEAAQTAYSEGDYDFVITLYRLLEKNGSLSVDDQARFASALIRSGRYILQGKEKFDEIINNYRQVNKYKFQYANALIIVGANLSIAESVLQSINENNRTEYWYRLYGDLLQNTNNSKDALSKYETAYDIILNNSHSLVTYKHAIKSARILGDEYIEETWLNRYEKSNLFDEYIEIELALFYCRNNRTDEAISRLTSIEKYCKHKPHFIFAYTKILCNTNNLPLANKMLVENGHLEKRKSQYDNALISAAYATYYDALGDMKGAILYIHKAIELDSNVDYWGQWVEIYIHIYQLETDINKRNEVYMNGVKFFNDIIQSKNVPAISSLKKLCNMANDKERIDIIDNTLTHIQDF